MTTRITTILHRLQHATAHSLKDWRWFTALFLAVLITQTYPKIDPAIPAAQSAQSILQNPSLLSEADASRYKMIFAMQSRGETDAADSIMAELENAGLIGHVLAERYLAKNYTASASELKDWLANFSDHPQAQQIARLAMARGLDVNIAALAEPLRGDGFIDHLGRTTMPDGWYRGLSLWREKNDAAAEQIFAKIGADDSLGDWQRAAGNYWAYRAADRAGDHSKADEYLTLAANYGATFYGLLASQQLGEIKLAAKAPYVSHALRNDPRAIRASLLSAIGRSDAAEDELRQLYAQTVPGARPGIVTLASEMGLANLQVRLARTPTLSAEEALFAKYPMPKYMLDAQHDVDPALLMAIARNESGFRPMVTSTGGAVGMMQMLPSTARAIERRMGPDALSLASNSGSTAIADRLSDPAVSVRFGAQYLRILMAEKAIGNNFIRLLAGYNAGPGTVASWQSAARTTDDPLLYVESIPYPETRNYVMQVMAQYWVYKTMLGEQPASLSATANGQWPEVMQLSAR